MVSTSNEYSGWAPIRGDQGRTDEATLLFGERRQQEREYLVEQDRRGDHEREVEGDRDRHRERLGEIGGDRYLSRGVGRQRRRSGGEVMDERLQRRRRGPRQVSAQMVGGAGGLEQLPAFLDLVARGAADVIARNSGEVVERPVEQVLEPAALPEAPTECHCQHGHADEQPATQLVEVTDDTEPIAIGDGSQSLHHGQFGPVAAPDQEPLLGALN
jgi:hypothetical protein